jgi:hypothetical protein
MKTYIIETVENKTQIGSIAEEKYHVRVSKGSGTGIWRRKLAVTTKKELDKRLNELAKRNIYATVLNFKDDSEALAYARETQEYLNN